MDEIKKYVSSEVFEQLLEANIDSLKCIILLDKVELQKKAKLGYNEAEFLQEKAAELLIAHKIKPASSISNWQHLSTGCLNIDVLCNGGLPCKGIIEIFGESGVGKTQLALQLSLIVQFSGEVGGFSKGVVYVCTEDAFPITRLHSLAQSLPERFNQSRSNFEHNVYVEHIVDYEQLRRLLYVRLPRLLKTVPIGLIVIDSIAGAFRSENVAVNYVTRSEEIYSVASKLSQLSREYNLAAVCINQVVDDVGTGQTKPCLGNTWANLVTSRFKISRLTQESKVRVFQVIKSPILQERRCTFLITPDGLVPYDFNL